MIAIIDYGAGNIQSVYKALKYIGAECEVTSDKGAILNADGAILPGVGSFGDAMDTLEKYDIRDTVKDFIATGKPFLGICLGLQLLFPKSLESPEAEGLGVLKGEVKKIPNGEGLKIPHMGWNSIKLLKKDGIFKDIEDESYVYFVHSYYLDAEDKNIVSAQTEYGVTIDAAVSYKNVTATQFHPEKSGDVGLKMLENFVKMCGGKD
ncbi:MAG: imidazole glycerol phosphate synthase subunit HisH [Ruminococcus sp.]|nr:imidazole glycerol phosphate synthase subunit HisH [Ruminococcus sp.]